MHEPPPTSPLCNRSATRWPWLATGLVMVIYFCVVLRWISASTAIPTFDQAAYVEQSYYLADLLYHRPLQLLNPWALIGGDWANRPPLFPLITAPLGMQADPRLLAMVWLGARMAVLGLALYALARRIGPGWWLPAASAVILAHPNNLTVYPHLLMADQMFEMVGLLVWVIGLYYLDQPTWRRGIGFVLSMIALLLIKPAALAWAFPLVMICGWVLYRQHRLSAKSRQWWVTTVLIPAGVGLGLLALLATTRYLPSVVGQYADGARGYWATKTSWIEQARMAGWLLAPWLLVPLLMILRKRQLNLMFISALLMGLWWWIFNAYITYTLDARIISAMSTVVVVGILTAITNRTGQIITTLVALGFFTLSLLSATGHLPVAIRDRLAPLCPLGVVQQPSVEVGLLPMAVNTNATIGILAPEAPHRLMLLCHDDFTETIAFRLALRRLGVADQYRFEYFCWHGTDQDLTHTFGPGGNQWFITKQHRQATPLQGDAFLNLTALHKLATNPDSPIAARFVRVLEQEVQLPDHHDTLTLWQLPTPLSPAEIRAAAAYILPLYTGKPGAAGIARQAQ